MPQWNSRHLFDLTIILHMWHRPDPDSVPERNFSPRYQTLKHIRLFVACFPHCVASFRCSLKLLHCTNKMFKFIWFTCFPSSLRNNNKKYIKTTTFTCCFVQCSTCLTFHGDTKTIIQRWQALNFFTSIHSDSQMDQIRYFHGYIHSIYSINNGMMLKMTYIYNI